jgi:hypothetical protein
VSCAKAVRVAISLSQRSSTTARAAYTSIGFIVVKSADKASRKAIILKGELVGSSGSFINKRDVSTEIELAAGQNYVIIPSTYEPHKESTFFLRVTSTSEPLDLRELTKQQQREAPAPVSVGKCSKCGFDVTEAYSSFSSTALLCAACLAASDRPCCGCGGPIVGSTITKTFAGKIYHTDCYRCCSCGTSLSKLTPTLSADGKLLCPACSRTCVACSKPIGADSCM